MINARIDLLEVTDIIDAHLTKALCDSAFDERRDVERRRVWTLHRMMEFWTAVILRAPKSLRQALDEAFHGTGGFLPGSLLGLYDLFCGIPRRLLFSEQAQRAEVPWLKEALDDIPAGTLLLCDRGFCSHVLFGEITDRGLFALVRCTKAIGLETVERLRRRRHQGGTLVETIVIAGTPQRKKQQQRLRLIEWKKGKKILRLLTNVLDPERLTATAAVALYSRRWTIERVFYDLKEVLNLHRFHAANVNAVAMQVHAAALVYVALRVAQGRIAQRAQLPPERLSVEKLFPRVAAAHFAIVSARLSFLATQKANPHVRLREPDWHDLPFASIPLASVLVEPRNGKRRKWRPPNGPHAS